MKALLIELKDATKPLGADNPVGVTFIPVSGQWVEVILSTAIAQQFLPMVGLPLDAGFPQHQLFPDKAGQPMDANNPLTKLVKSPVANSAQVLEFLEANVINYAGQLMAQLGALIPDPAEG